MLSLLDVTENLIQSEHKNWEYSINFFDAFCRICKLTGKDKITIIPIWYTKYHIPYINPLPRGEGMNRENKRSINLQVPEFSVKLNKNPVLLREPKEIKES